MGKGLQPGARPGNSQAVPTVFWFRKMGLSCDAARRALSELVGGAGRLSAELEAHLALCPACRAFLLREQQLHRRLRRLPRVPAPATLRATIRARLRGDRVSHRRYRVAWMLAGSIAAALALVWLGRAEPGTPAELALPLANIAQDGLERTERVDTLAEEAVMTWLRARAGYTVDLPRMGGAVLVGARTERVDGSPAATLVYLVNGMPVTYFAVPSRRILGYRLEADTVTSHAADGYEVAFWTERGQARALAAPRGRVAVRELAEECRRAALD